jgi:hypothetical protein
VKPGTPGTLFVDTVHLLCGKGSDGALAQCCAAVPELAEHSFTHRHATAREDKAASGDVRTTTSGAPRLSIPSRAGGLMFRQHTLHPRPRVLPGPRARQRSRMGMERGVTQTRSANGRNMNEGRKKGGRMREPEGR